MSNPYIQYFTQTNELNLWKSFLYDVFDGLGMDVKYLPRDYQVDGLWNEDYLSNFTKTYDITVYIESFEGYDGEGDILQSLGLSVDDRLNLLVHPDQFEEQTGMKKPLEGDLIYFTLSHDNGIFEIKYLEHEDPYYQLAGITMLRMQTELFQYNQEEFDTGDIDIDSIDDEAITGDDTAQNERIETEANESRFSEDNPFGSY